MKKSTLLFTTVLVCLLAHAQTTSTIVTINETQQKTLSEIIAYGLPVVYVQTVNGEEPTCEVVYAPAGSWGTTINSENVHGRMTMYSRIANKDSVLYDSGDYEKDVSGMSIRIRGNTSANSTATGPKMPYKIKLQKKQDLLFRGVDSVYKDKEWVLLKDDYLLTSTAFMVSRLVGMNWVPAAHYVNVVLNDKYRGIYLLCEMVKRNPKCRLNVDKNSGFIFECDIYWWNESVYVTSVDAPSYNYTFKYPDDEDITEEQLVYMQSLVNAYEASIPAGTYPELIDVASFAKWCLVHDIEGTKDGGGANRYYTKYDTTAQSKIVMPLAWDFDLAERTPSAWSRCHLVYMGKFFNNPNPTFVNEFVRAWVRIRNNFKTAADNELIAFANSAQGNAMQSSFHLNNAAWGVDLWFQNQLLYRRQWLQQRYDWLDTNIMAMHIPYDVNIDGELNVSDVTALISMVLGTDDDKLITGDINEDGQINVTDVTLLINYLISQPR